MSPILKKFDDIANERQIILGDNFNVKNFTAVVVLKLKHQFFIYNKFNDPQQFKNLKEPLVMPSKYLTVKIYYQLMDNMVNLIPRCQEPMHLKNCIYNETKKVFTFISNKY